MQTIFWFFVWLTLFAGWPTPVAPAGSMPAPQISEEVLMNKPFVLAYGSTVTLDGGELAITFVRVVEDSRCPVDVMCAWSGQAVVAVRLQAAGEDAQTAELGGFTDYEGSLRPQRPESESQPSAEIGAYTVQLLAVTPYPATAAEPLAADEYAISLVVHSRP